MTWTPIDIKDHSMSTYPKGWTLDAIRCHELNRDCSRCIIKQALGRSWNGAMPCQMPLAIQSLLDDDIPIPTGKKLEELSNKETCVTHYGVKKPGNHSGQWKMDLEKAREVRRLHGLGTSMRALAKRFNVSEKTIYNVLNNAVHKEPGLDRPIQLS